MGDRLGTPGGADFLQYTANTQRLFYQYALKYRHARSLAVAKSS